MSRSSCGPCGGCCECGKRWRTMQQGFYVVVVWPTKGQRRYYSTHGNVRDSYFSVREAEPRVFASVFDARQVAHDLLASRLARKALVRQAKVVVKRRAVE